MRVVVGTLAICLIGAVAQGQDTIEEAAQQVRALANFEEKGVVSTEAADAERTAILAAAKELGFDGDIKELRNFEAERNVRSYLTFGFWVAAFTLAMGIILYFKESFKDKLPLLEKISYPIIAGVIIASYSTSIFGSLPFFPCL